MKIDKVILGSDTNPFYLDFWPIVSMIWKKKFKIEPILILIHDNKNITVTEEYGKVFYIDPVENVPLNIQAQCCRYFFPLTDLEAIWCISDIDMLPISTNYFIESIKHISDEKFVNLNSHSIAANPACYNIAKGKTYKEVLDLPETFEKFLKQTEWWKREGNHSPDGKLQKTHWFTDEQYSNEKIFYYHKNINPDKFVNPPRPGGYCQRRADRINWDSWKDEDIINEFILDAHSIRPYTENKESIDKLVKLIMKNYE